MFFRIPTVIALLLLASILRAQPIVIDLASADGSITASISGNSVTDVFDAIVARENELSIFAGTAFTANVDYLGVPNSVQLNVAADGKSATLVIPSIGLNQSFDANSPGTLQTQIETYVHTDGSAQLAEFRKEVNKVSSAGVTDGNPNATTSQLADAFFQAFALRTPSLAAEDGRRWRFTLRGRSSQWTAEGLSGRSVASDLELDWQPRARWTLTGLLPLTYSETGGAETYGAGAGLGLTYDVLPAAAGSPWDARTTLFGGAMFRGSEKLAAGGGIWSWGMTGVLNRHLSRFTTVGLAVQGSAFHGIPMAYQGFQLDRAVNQQIVKAGFTGDVKLPRFNHGLDADLIETRLLQAAAIQSYVSLGVGYHWRWFGGSVWRIGYEQSAGRHFHSDTLRFRTAFRF